MTEPAAPFPSERFPDSWSPDGLVGSQPSAPRGDPDDRVFRLGGPEELLAAIPFMWGFHPEDSLVLIGLRRSLPRVNGVPGARHPRSCFGARTDLPDGGYRADVEALAGYLTAELVGRGADLAIVVAYSDDEARAAEAVNALIRDVEDAGVDVHDALRADGKRWWSYRCTNTDCCPPDGTPYDLTANRITADAVFSGRRVYANRDEIRALVAPRSDTREAMQRATEHAEDELTELWSDAIGSRADDAAPDGFGAACELVVAAGSAAVRSVVARFLETPGPIADEDAATLSVYCGNLLIRDAAWLTMTRENASRQVELWQQVTGRALPPYDVPPAALLAFAAWLAGDPALARIAIERALAGDSDYSLALLTAETLRSGLAPSAWEAMTPADPGDCRGSDRD